MTNSNHNKWDKLSHVVPHGKATIEGHNVIAANAAFCKILNTPKNDVLGMDLSSLYRTPEGFDEFVTELRRATSKQDKIVIATSWCRYDGKVAEIIVHATPILQSKVEKWTIDASDITAIYKMNRLQKRHENTLSVILNHSPIGFGLLVLDPSGNRVMGWYNPAMGEIFGYDKRELLGKSTRILYEDDDTFQKAGKFIKSQIEKHGICDFTPRIIHRDGTKLDVRVIVTPVHLDNEISLLTIVEDITERKKAEAAVQESEKRYRLLADNISDNLWTFDLSTMRFSYLSPSVYGITGFTPEEAIDFTLEDFMTPPSYEVASKILVEELFESSQHYDPSRSRTFEVELHHKEGRTVWAEASVRFIYDNTHQPVALMGVTRDISKRKRAEDALRISEAFRKVVFDSSRIPIVVMDITTGAYIDCNPAVVAIYEFSSREETLGKTQMDVSAPIQYDGMPSAEKARFYIDKAHSEGSVIFEWRHQRQSGEIWDAEVHLMSFRDGQRELLQFFLIDITERKKTEVALQESEKRYRLLADNISDNIWIFDLETMRFSYVSPSIEGITGFTEEEAIGSRLEYAMTPLSFERVNKILEEEMTASTQNFDPTRSRTMELEFCKKNGSTVWTETVAKFIYDQKSQPIALLGATRDISERKKFQNQLHKSQKMESLGLLAGSVAHDLNNVLSGIVSYPELLLINLHDDSQLRKPLKTIMESGNRAAAIVQDLLTIARGVAIIKEPLKLNDLVSGYFDSPEFKKLKHFYPGVTFKTHLAKNLLNINASDVHISKALMNLIANATEAVKKSGNVSLSTGNRFLDRSLKGYEEIDIGEYAVLSVADDGPGISTRDLQRIFEPFYTKKKMGRSGTGLGLSIVWNVMRDHKGYIDVKSDGNGTLFELYFPISRDAILKTDINLSLTRYKGNEETILVVDDIESQREISSRMLDILGYKYKAVSSGEKAIEYLKQNTVNLILLDMIMDPGINGYETFKQIIKIHPGQKAIILSGFSETNDVKSMQSLGAGKYLKKPITLEKLGLAIKEELEK